MGGHLEEADRRSLRIDGFELCDASDCYVVAEIGHNHQGSVDQAIKLFEAAHRAGANAVKLQKRDNRTLFTRQFLEQPYDNENSFGDTYGAHRDALELGRSEYAELKAYAAELGITFFATAFDFASADFLADLGMPAYKIASGDLRNTPLLRYVAEIGKPVIFSTGHGTIEDVVRAHQAVAEVNPQVAILQCTASYPAEWAELDLRVIETFRSMFPDTVIGFSAHDNGIAMSLAAYVLGARIVEKHFTLNRALRGTDHAFSLEPQGLTKLVRDLRRARLAYGSGEKTVYASEARPISRMAKKLVASAALPAGHVLRPADVALKSPGDGLPPYELECVLGRRLREPVVEDQTLTFELLEPAYGEAEVVLGTSRTDEPTVPA